MDDEQKILAAARRHLGVKAADVMSWGIHGDEIWVVVYPGPKHKIKLSELETKERKSDGKQSRATVRRHS